MSKIDQLIAKFKELLKAEAPTASTPSSTSVPPPTPQNVVTIHKPKKRRWIGVRPSAIKELSTQTVAPAESISVAKNGQWSLDKTDS